MEKDILQKPQRKRKILLLTVSILILVLLQNISFAIGIPEKQKAARWNEDGIEALDKGEFLDAIGLFQRALELLPDNKTIKANLGIAYNNYALFLNKKKDTETAKKYLYRAIETDHTNSKYKENLANIIYSKAEKLYQNRDYSSAANELQETLGFLHNHTPSLILLGQIHYQKQELSQAKTLWEKAYKYDPGNTDLRKLLSKLKKEQKVEKEFKQLDAYYFDIRFDKEVVNNEIYDIRFFLKEAYRNIGRDFNYYPTHKIPVILYTQEDFKILRKTPDWVAGIFDGKIRLPVKKDTLSETSFKRLIWHEYTHAIILDLTQGRCPIWFNEGLAKWEESKQYPPDVTALKDAIEKKSLIPLSELESCFSLHTKAERTNLAYLEAYSFIEFILDRWNFYVIREILVQLKNGRSIEEAFYEQVSRSFDRLDKEWLEYLQKTYCH